MWRAIFAISYADGHISSEEENYILERLNSLPFNSDQRIQITEDLKKKTDIKEFFSLIVKPSNKSVCLHLMRGLAQKDGVYSEDEKKMINSISQEMSSKLNTEDLREKIKFDVSDSKLSLIDKISNFLF